MMNRQFSILYQLMRKDNVTARELAERFEVSVRTIYRDVEFLSMAGIPIFTKKGRDGGIFLMDHFVLDRMIITEGEKRNIMAALESLAEVEKSDTEFLTKLGDFFQIGENNWVSVDFSDWSDRRQELYSLIKYAILNRRAISFDYYGSNGVMERRMAEPVQLRFKSRTWYLYAWCRKRKAMRLFKLLRMKRTECLDETFTSRTEGEKTVEAENAVTGEADALNEEKQTGKVYLDFTLRIAASEAYRLYDSFEEEEISEEQDGSFMVRTGFPLDNWVYALILSYCPYVEVLDPPWLRAKLREILKSALDQNGKI